MFRLENSYSLPDPERRICAGHVSASGIVLSTVDGAFHVLTPDGALVYTRQDSEHDTTAVGSFARGSDNDDEVLVVSQGPWIRTYSFATGVPYHDLRLPHDTPVMMLKTFQLGPAGSSDTVRQTMLASADLKGEILLWDTNVGVPRLRHTLTGHGQKTTYLSLHPNDGGLLISGSYDGSIRIWNIGTGEQTLLLEVAKDEKISRSFTNSKGVTCTYTESVSSMIVAPDGRLIAGGVGGFVRVWDSQTGKLERSWQAHDGGNPRVGPVLNKILLHPSERAFLTTGTNGSICLWDLSTYQLLRKIKPFEHSTLSQTIAWYGDKLICAGKDGAPENVCGDFNRVIVWDLSTLRLQEGSSESWSELGAACNAVHSVYVVGPRIVMFVTRKGTGAIEVWKEFKTSDEQEA